MHVEAGVVVRRVVDGSAVGRRVVHVAQGAIGLEDLRTDFPVVAAAHVVLGGFAGDVGIGFVDAAGHAGIGEVGILLGETVRDLVRRYVEADQREEGVGAVAEGHRAAVPEGVLVVVAVVHPHHQLEGQRRDADVGAVHVVDDFAEIMRVVQRRIGAVDGLHGVARAGVDEGDAAAGAVVEVDGLHHGIVHGAVAADRFDVHEAVVGAVFVLPGLGVAARAGADGRMRQAFPLLEYATAGRIEHDEGPGRRAAAGAVGEEIDDIGAMRAALRIEIDHQANGFVLDAHFRQARAERDAAGDLAGAAGGHRRGGAGEILIEAGEFLPEQAADDAAPFADDHLLAEDRQAAERLLITVVMGAVAIGIMREDLQARFGIEAQEFGMALGRAGRAEALRGQRILVVESGEVGLVEIAARGGAAVDRQEQADDGESQRAAAQFGNASTEHGIPRRNESGPNDTAPAPNRRI